MNYKQLEALIYVTRNGTFKQAAESLYFDSSGEEYITPESIQYRIKQLEQELGVSLYRKRQGSSRVLLTREGQLFLREALEVFSRMSEWRSMFLESEKGRLTFATTQTVLIHRMVDAIREFHTRHPNVRVQALNATAAEMENLVGEGRIDFGISTRQPETGELEYVPWKKSPMVLVLPKGHALSGRRDVSLMEIADHPLILLEPEMRGDRELVDESFRKAGIKRPNVVIETSNSEVILTYVEAGIGVSVIAETNLANTRREVDFVRLDPKVIGKTEVGLLVREGQFLSFRAREFLTFLDPSFRDWLAERDVRMEREAIEETNGRTGRSSTAKVELARAGLQHAAAPEDEPEDDNGFNLPKRAKTSKK
ncbi:MAG: LysR substrate-binding domain-containing protein [Sumerlaeia bacterium]